MNTSVSQTHLAMNFFWGGKGGAIACKELLFLRTHIGGAILLLMSG